MVLIKKQRDGFNQQAVRSSNNISKKGQGLSLNVIIIAALALIVLVILVAIFINQIGKTEQGISQVSNLELAKLKITYSDCRPSQSEETAFLKVFSNAESEEITEDEVGFFEEKIATCSANAEKTTCESVAGCTWK